MDGWSPEYPIPVSDDHLSNAPVAGVTESKKSRDEIKNLIPEVNPCNGLVKKKNCHDHFYNYY